MTAAADALALFGGFGTRPAGTWSAPGRVNLIGEHTDYNGGFALPFAIDRRTHVVAGANGTGEIRVASTFAAGPVRVPLAELARLFPAVTTPAIPRWAAYPLGVAWALRQEAAQAGAGSPDAGVDVAIASEVPVGAGLSSSAAVESATAVALNDLWALGLDATALARAGRRAENEAVGVPTGIMDQMASVHGRADAAVFLDCRALTVDVVELGFAEAGLEVVVIDTGAAHEHATGGYRTRREACERGAAALGVRALREVSIPDLDRARRVTDPVTFRRVRHVVTEDQRVLDTVRVLRTRGPGALGALLDASHASLRDDFEISTPALDTAVRAARSAGALGARMTGGGFGGAAIALVPHGRLDAVADAATRAFAAAGFAAPHVFPVTPSRGARRDG